MRRREFINLIGGAAAWPLAARAQQPERVRRVGVLMSLAADDPEGQARLAAFLQGLQELGWTDGLNVSVDVRSTAGDAERIRREAVKLVAFAPDVILAVGGQVVGAYSRRPAPCRWYLHRLPTRLGPASSKAWHGQTEMPPDLPSSNTG